MNLHRFPALIFIVSFVGVAVSLWLSRTFELVPHCRVFIDGCISISAAGRQEPAVFVFRGTIIPVGVLLVLVWWLNTRWLLALGQRSRVVWLSLSILGTFSPLLLISYIALIGSAGEIDHAIRQVVISTYFPATLVAKIILSVQLLKCRPVGLAPWLPRTMLAVAIVVLAIAVSSVIFEALLDDPSIVHNLTQWYGTLAFAAWYLLLASCWRRTGFELEATRLKS